MCHSVLRIILKLLFCPLWYMIWLWIKSYQYLTGYLNRLYPEVPLRPGKFQMQCPDMKGEDRMKDGMICNCKQVSYADVENALHQMDSFSDVLSAFEDVQKITHCSTGCGGCHDKILDAISEIMMK